MKPATPLPWETFYSNYDTGTLCIFAVDDARMIVAYDDPVADTIKPEDAAYIAHACNLYPELVKELRDLVQAIYAEVPDTDDMEKTQPDLYIECGTAEQLLAKCEEE